jgi:ApaG protein
MCRRASGTPMRWATCTCEAVASSRVDENPSGIMSVRMPDPKDQPFHKGQPIHPPASEAVTKDIRVEVESRYAPEQSDLPEQQWVFQYTIRITNEGDETVQLLSRHWIITDVTGRTDEVRGPGVVGEQPVLAPGESFEYSSWCPLKAPIGVMRGTYQMINENGSRFDVEIAPFALRAPYTVH